MTTKQKGRTAPTIEAYRPYGTWQPSPSTDKGGRPTRVFLLGTGGNGYETSWKPEENLGSVAVASVANLKTQAEEPGEWGEL